MSDNQFSDEIDRANYIADLAAPEQKQDESGAWETEECVDCGEDIEEQRLAMGKVRCFSCQSIKEKKEKNYARY